MGQYCKNTAGTMALAWAVSCVGVVVAVGSAYDVAQITKAKSIAQLAADRMALAASIAVDTNNENRYQAGQSYPYTQIGGPAGDFTNSMTGSVQYDVDDDGDGEGNLLARATVSGSYTPAFMSILGVDGIEFSATSDVAYAQREGTPASVFFAVDNSGSMGWSDASGANKLTALKNSLKDFMTTLEAINNDQNTVFRTALWPYSQDFYGYYYSIDDDGIIPSKVVDPNWGGLTNSEIDNMVTLYGTDSSGALQNAADAFASENAVHNAANNEDDPLKFMIFMSDGANNPQTEQQCTTEQVWVNGDPEYWWRWKYSWWWGWYKQIRYYQPHSGNWNYVAATDGYYEEQETCENVTVYRSDELSLEACDAMKSDGVTVYTIGYYLVAGWHNGYYVSQAEVDRAQALLSDCASDSDKYILASNAADLNAALAEIGQEVMKEVIRIKR